MINKKIYNEINQGQEKHIHISTEFITTYIAEIRKWSWNIIIFVNTSKNKVSAE